MVRKKNSYLFIFSLVSLLIMFIGAMFLFFGVSSNYLAVTENGCKMPVLSKTTWSTETHFSYDKPLDINYSSLSDIFYIGKYIYSIGDLLFYLGFGLIIMGTIVQMFIIIKIIYKRHIQPSPKKRIFYR